MVKERLGDPLPATVAWRPRSAVPGEPALARLTLYPRCSTSGHASLPSAPRRHRTMLGHVYFLVTLGREVLLALETKDTPKCPAEHGTAQQRAVLLEVATVTSVSRKAW